MFNQARFQGIVFLFLFLLFLVKILMNCFSTVPGFLEIVMGFLAMILYILSLSQTKKTNLVLSVTFLLFGSFFILYQEISLISWLIGFNRLIDVVLLIVLISLLGIPIEMGLIDRMIAVALRKNNNKKGLYILIFGLSILLGTFLNIALIPIIYFSINRKVSNLRVDAERFLTTSIKRGLSLALLWSPLGVTIAISTEYTGVTWLEIIPYGVALVVLGVIISLITEKVIYSGGKGDSTSSDNNTGTNHEEEYREIASFSKTMIICNLLYMILLITLILVLSYRFDVGMVNTLIILSMIFPLLWQLVIGNLKPFLQRFKNQLNEDIPGSSSYIALLIGVGVFISGIQMFNLGENITLYINQMQLHLGTYFLLTIISIFLVFISIIGLHPLVVVILLAENINFADLSFPPELITISLVVGGVMSMLLSPFGTSTMLISKLVNRSLFEVSLRWNLRFALWFFLTMPLLIYLVDCIR